jgi:hypothetical protein
VESSEGAGRLFWFELPVEQLADATPDNCGVTTAMPVKTPRYDLRILLVEDNAINREVATALFESFGADVTTATAAKQRSRR